jgi:ribosome-binding factor A
MPKDYPRTRRIDEQLQRELASLIRDHVQDPRLGMVTVSAVRTSKDMRHAKVYVTVLEDEKRTGSLQALAHAAGFLRTLLAHRIRMKVIPDLRFRYDESVERGRRVSRLIDEAVRADETAHDPTDASELKGEP